MQVSLLLGMLSSVMGLRMVSVFSPRGTDELLGVMDRVHIVNSTLGKALGGAAGKCCYNFEFLFHFYIKWAC